MAVKDQQQNIDQNKFHYDKHYSHVNVDSIIKVLERKDSFLSNAKKTEISWVGMYHDDFEKRIPNRTVLELGCGDCINAAVMASCDARVTANDISDRSGEIVSQLNGKYKFREPLKYIWGDFTKSECAERSFDFVVGKAFLHHLTLDLEDKILEKVSRVLKEDGEARFFEPAINNKILDELRWAMPMNDRPSKWFQPKAFKAWEAADPHPHRDNSSSHFEAVGLKYFSEVEIIPLGIFERFNRLIRKSTKRSGRFKQWALKFERNFPLSFRRFGARSQLVIYRKPRVHFL